MDFDPGLEVESAMAKLRSAYLNMCQQVKQKEKQLDQMQQQLETMKEQVRSQRSGARNIRPSPASATRNDTLNNADANANTNPNTNTNPIGSPTAAGARKIVNSLMERWAIENRASPEQLRHLPWMTADWKELYPAPPIPCDDEERCRIVDELFILDSEEEELYNDLCAVARKMLNVELVCVDIVARDRIWFKASSIAHPKLSGFKTAPRNLAPCNYVVKKGSTLVIPDMHADSAFQLNPLTKLDCSFYAGSPLTTAAGVHVGVFAVLDSRSCLPFGKREEAILELMAATTIRQLESRKATLSMNKMKDQFLANMSHELRTPLHGIIGVTQLLASTPIDGLQKEYVSDAQQQAHVLLHIVNDLLDFAKLNADKIKIELEKCYVHSMLTSVTRQMQITANPKQITLDLQATNIPLDAVASLDSHRISQILANLLSNSIKFSGTGSTVVLKAWMTSSRPQEPTLLDENGIQIRTTAPTTGLLSAASNAAAVAAAAASPSPSPMPTSTAAHTDSQKFLVFSVQDRGMGMASSLIPRLFDSFAQEDATSSRAFGGSGLGLSISRRMAKLMGGDLFLQESKKGFGTIMLGYVLAGEISPAAAAAAAAAAEQTTMSSHASSAHATMPNSIDDSTQTESGSTSGSATPSNRRDDASIDTPKQPTTEVGPDDTPPTLVSTPPQVVSTPTLSPSIPLSAPLPNVTLAAPPATLSATASTTTPPVLTRPRAKHKLSGPVLTILVVDDLPLNIKIASRLLEGMGHKVYSALSGMEAVDMVKKMHFDCVLMDVQMPEMNGYVATKHIRDLEGPSSSIPSAKAPRRSLGDSPAGDVSRKARITILAFTASAMPDERQACLTAGMDDVLTKPLDRSILTARLQEVQEIVANVHRAA